MGGVVSRLRRDPDARSRRDGGHSGAAQRPRRRPGYGRRVGEGSRQFTTQVANVPSSSDLAADVSLRSPRSRRHARTGSRIFSIPGSSPGTRSTCGVPVRHRRSVRWCASRRSPEIPRPTLSPCVSISSSNIDGDDSYEQALYDTFEKTTKPLALLSNLHSAIDPAGSGRLREAGIPVLEGSRTGLLAMRHLLELRDLGQTSPCPAWCRQIPPGPVARTAVSRVTCRRSSRSRSSRITGSRLPQPLRSLIAPPRSRRHASSACRSC